MFTLPFNAWGEIFQFFSLGGSYQAKISQVIRRGFLYVKNSLHSCIYLSFFPDILISCDREFVFRFLSMCKVSQKCQRTKEKGTITKAKTLFVGDLEIFPKKSLHREREREIL